LCYEPELIPDLFALQYRDIVQNLLKDLIWQKEIWDQLSDYKNVAMVNNPLVYWPGFTGGQLI